MKQFTHYESLIANSPTQRKKFFFLKKSKKSLLNLKMHRPSVDTNTSVQEQ